MEQNVITAEEIFSEKLEQIVWAVAVSTPEGKKMSLRKMSEPLKAIRYAFMLKARVGVRISQGALDMLVNANKQMKAALQKEQNKEEQKHLHEVAENLIAEDKKKRTRRTKKSEKAQEEAK